MPVLPGMIHSEIHKALEHQWRLYAVPQEASSIWQQTSGKAEGGTACKLVPAVPAVYVKLSGREGGGVKVSRGAAPGTGESWP